MLPRWIVPQRIGRVLPALFLSVGTASHTGGSAQELGLALPGGLCGWFTLSLKHHIAEYSWEL